MKKNAKKLMSLMLALLMVFGIYQTSSSEVYAANEGSLTIHKLSSEPYDGTPADTTGYQLINGEYYAYLDGAEYTIYEIGTMTQTNANGVVSSTFTPNSGLKDTDGANITTLDSSTDASKIDEATATYVDSKTTTASGSIKFENLDPNKVYLVKETVTPTGVNKANDFIITVPMYVDGEWIYDVEAYPKNIVSIPSIAKTIVTGSGETDTYYANIGDTVNYKIEVIAPLDMSSVSYTDFKIIDTSSQYLGIDTGTVVVSGSVNGTFALGTDYSLSYSGNVLTIEFTATGIAKINDKETITVTYDAEILEEYTSTSNGGITNSAELYLKYDNKEIPVKPTDPDPVVKLFSYGVKKVGDNNVALAGAKFVVTNSTGSYLKYNTTTGVWSEVASIDDATVFETSTTGSGTDTEAILQFINLEKGTYYLVETEAPADYITLPESIKIEVSETTTDAVYASYDEDGVYQAGVAGSVGFTTLIKNTLDSDNPGFLPSTGGNGIYMFLLAGGILVVGAAALFFISKKKEEENN